MAGSAHTPASATALAQERKAFLDLLRMANTLASPEEIARQIVVLASYLSGCEAVAIRLKAGPNYPYAGSVGFSESFLSGESDLCAKDEAGHLLRDEHRQPVLACICGQVLTGHIERSQAQFTDRGSFITHSTTELKAAIGPGCANGIRHQCNHAGYETVGLFPIRRDDVTYGLIQCNDPRPSRLSADAVDLLEHLAATSAHLFQLAMT
jgi:hypothetical protein